MTATRITATGCLTLLSMIFSQQAVLAERAAFPLPAAAAGESFGYAARAADAIREPSAGQPSTWNPATDGAVSDAGCEDAREWEATQRAWMSRDDAWCSVGIRFKYAGSRGDIKIVVRKQNASAGAARRLHVSADLPANGGETSPFQFIFPCPAAAADRLCLSYESTSSARELSYDFLELGADGNSHPEDSPPQKGDALADTYFAADSADRPSVVAQVQPVSRDRTSSSGDEPSDSRRVRAAGRPRPAQHEGLGLAAPVDAGPAISSDLAQAVRQSFEPAHSIDLEPLVPAPMAGLRKRRR